MSQSKQEIEDDVVELERVRPRRAAKNYTAMIADFFNHREHYPDYIREDGRLDVRRLAFDQDFPFGNCTTMGFPSHYFPRGECDHPVEGAWQVDIPQLGNLTFYAPIQLPPMRFDPQWNTTQLYLNGINMTRITIDDCDFSDSIWQFFYIVGDRDQPMMPDRIENVRFTGGHFNAFDTHFMDIDGCDFSDISFTSTGHDIAAVGFFRINGNITHSSFKHARALNLNLSPYPPKVVTGCDFSGAHIPSVVSYTITYRHNNFTGTRFESWQSQRDNVEYCSFQNSVVGSFVFQASNVTDSNFSNITFTGADNSWSDTPTGLMIWWQSNFARNRFQGSRINGIDAHNTGQSDINISSIDFRGAQLNRANFAGEVLRGDFLVDDQTVIENSNFFQTWHCEEGSPPTGRDCVVGPAFRAQLRSQGARIDNHTLFGPPPSNNPPYQPPSNNNTLRNAALGLAIGGGILLVVLVMMLLVKLVRRYRSRELYSENPDPNDEHSRLLN